MRAGFHSFGARVGGDRFFVHHEPRGAPRGAVLCVHPFGEEMNKSRRMLALGSRALSEAGYAVLQIDLYGCGDSPGDWASARWQDWVDDVEHGGRWLTERYSAPLWIWGLRAGCLLAADAARSFDARVNFLFWQPQSSGSQVLRQFLRLRLAAHVRQGPAKENAEGLRSALARGEQLQVAGYRIGSGLADGLEQSRLHPPSDCANGRRLILLETSSRTPLELTPIGAEVSAQWTAAGIRVDGRAVSGPPFWGTVEVEEAPELIDASIAAIQVER